MRAKLKLGAIAVLALLLTGCAKPTTVKTLKTPLPGLTLTFEMWENGSLASDRTKLVAHFMHGGKEYTGVIFDGSYVVISQYRWVNPPRLILCYKSGHVVDFTNEIRFWVEQHFYNFHVSLKEDC
jgi:hypothetical protein